MELLPCTPGAISSTGCSLGRSESLGPSLSLCRGVGIGEGLGAGALLPETGGARGGGPTGVSFGPFLVAQENQSSVLTWSTSK